MISVPQNRTFYLCLPLTSRCSLWCICSTASFTCGTLSPVSIASFTTAVPQSNRISQGRLLNESTFMDSVLKSLDGIYLYYSNLLNYLLNGTWSFMNYSSSFNTTGGNIGLTYFIYYTSLLTTTTGLAWSAVYKIQISPGIRSSEDIFTQLLLRCTVTY